MLDHFSCLKQDVLEILPWFLL